MLIYAYVLACARRGYVRECSEPSNAVNEPLRSPLLRPFTKRLLELLVFGALPLLVLLFSACGGPSSHSPQQLPDASTPRGAAEAWAQRGTGSYLEMLERPGQSRSLLCREQIEINEAYQANQGNERRQRLLSLVTREQLSMLTTEVRILDVKQTSVNDAEAYFESRSKNVPDAWKDEMLFDFRGQLLLKVEDGQWKVCGMPRTERL